MFWGSEVGMKIFGIHACFFNVYLSLYQIFQGIHGMPDFLPQLGKF